MGKPALGADKKTPAQDRGAAVQDVLEHLTLTGRHGGAKARQIIRSALDQQLMETQRRLRRGGRSDQRPALEIAHEPVQTLLVLSFTEAG
jgi:hypothetical protein